MYIDKLSPTTINPSGTQIGIEWNKAGEVARDNTSSLLFYFDNQKDFPLSEHENFYTRRMLT